MILYNILIQFFSVPTDAPPTRSPDASPGALQIIDEPMVVETGTEETATNNVLTNTTGGKAPQLVASIFGDGNP
jgi:hypothetical protein